MGQRAVVIAAGVFVASCAAIVGLRDPGEVLTVDPNDEGGTTPDSGGTSGSSGASSGSSGVDSSSGSSGNDAAPVDAGTDTPPGCVLKPNGAKGCTKNADCCSGQCREDGECVGKCEVPPPNAGTCPFFPNYEFDCCVGFYCGGGSTFNATCKPCVDAGQPLGTDPNGAPTPRSCCSKSANATTCN